MTTRSASLFPSIPFVRLKAQAMWLPWLAASLLLLGRVFYLNGPGILIDDAYISFRYAQNMSEGHGLVYNPGERVEGYTNFLWTVTLAVADWLGFDMALASKLLLGASALGILWLINNMAGKLFAPKAEADGLLYAFLPVFLFAAMGSQARYVLSGMETLFFVLWLTVAVYLLLFTQRPLLTGFLFALTALTRPEGALYFALAFGYHLLVMPRPGLTWSQRVQASMMLLLGFALPYAAYILWRFQYYGYLLPNTYYAKASGFSWQRIGRGWNILWTLLLEWRLLLPLGLAALALFSWRQQRHWLLLASFTGATLVYFVYVGGDFTVWFGPRFLMPFLPFLLLMMAEGLRLLVNRLAKFQPQVGLLAGVLLFAWLSLDAVWYSWPAKFQRMEIFTAQMQSWMELGKWLDAQTPPETRIATDAAGLIAFYSARYTIDMFGLTEEHIAHLALNNPGQGVVAHEKYDPEYILSLQPDCIVSSWMDQDGQAVSAGLKTVQAELQRDYQLAAVAKVRYGPPDDQQWVIATSVYDSGLYELGYQTGVYCRTAIP